MVDVYIATLAMAKCVHGLVLVQESIIGVQTSSFGTAQVYLIAISVVAETILCGGSLLRRIFTRPVAHRFTIATLVWMAVLLEDVYEPNQSSFPPL